MDDALSSYLAENIKALRHGRRLTQQSAARASGVPRATWANLESGAANPTLAVLHRVADALRVPLEELVARPRSDVRHYPAGSLPVRQRGRVRIGVLLPDPLPGTTVERLELPAGEKLTGVPHAPGTREYLTCERGELELVASADSYRLRPGDVVVFRGDQRHSYANTGKGVAVGYSVVLFRPAG
jgi:transcriptional regulator with XRE-family HTH domain